MGRRSHFVSASLLGVLMLSSCSVDSSFQKSTSLADTSLDGPSSGGTSSSGGSSSSSGGTTPTIQNFKPALAVRGMECMLCHAEINSNIITDFGYGDSSFFAGETNGGVGGEIYGDLPWYGDYYGTWQLATALRGTVFIPKAQLADENFLNWLTSNWQLASGSNSAPPLPSPLSLAGYLELGVPSTFYAAGDPTAGSGPQVPGGGAQITESTSVYIGAPTAAELLGDMTQSVPWQAMSGASISGLVANSGFVTNDPTAEVSCTGDVVISEPLLLSDATIRTNAGGCRLYSTNTIFIEGQISYATTASTENLQLSSARGIMMGFSYDPGVTNPDSPSVGDTRSTLTFRLGHWFPDSQPLTRGSGTNTEKIAAILADAAAVGASNLEDSTDASACPTQMLTYTAYNGGNSATTLTQCQIDYSRLLLNAPNIQSRYVGTFTGVVIAEIALFAPGALSFQYDHTFDTVTALPLLGTSVLDVVP